MGWAYQSASKRLGIVDLFACEIGTLCRVGTIFDIGKRYVDAYFAAPSDKPPSCASFVSKEEYFPVFASIRGTSSSSRNPWSTTSPNFIRT